MAAPKRTLKEKAEHWWWDLSIVQTEALGIQNPQGLDIDQVVILYIKHNPKPAPPQRRKIKIE